MISSIVRWQPPQPVPAAQWAATEPRHEAPQRTAARMSRSEIPLQWQTIIDAPRAQPCSWDLEILGRTKMKINVICLPPGARPARPERSILEES
jgi:hypothetical protein